MTEGGTTRPRDVLAQSKIIKKMFLSVGIGTIAYLLTNVLIEQIEEPQIWAITLSLLIGGYTFLTQFMHDLENRMHSVEKAESEHSQRVAGLVDSRFTAIDDVLRDKLVEIDKVVQGGFAKINEATQLFGLVEASALRTDAVTQLVRHSTQIDPQAPELVFRFAQAEIGRMSEFLKELSEGGNVTYEGEDRDWMLSLAGNCRSSIDAISLTTVDARGSGFVDGSLWTSDLGQRYLEVQRDALDRGVRIRRVFILDRPGLADDPMFMENCLLQKEMGIEVRLLDTRAIPGTRRSSLFDFILFDDVISYESTPASSIDGSIRPTIVTTRLELRATRVKDRLLRFKDLYSSARPIHSADENVLKAIDRGER
ncbi:phosphatidylserine/phosphatidylglycerophosphate/cardiolipin synthase family protein [Dactylosporangium sucinum]|uniref:Phosphatidylserine/phosphatidylglycerophosphate/ cardiolipin synthase family protein n=2 Tax=Dactylosporangium sucinum TaxID=1424081 RepID=A0A917U933_9ACTN|nr:phosphatidylserine/phosphatidylglycerophosphate/cardiolipin synthase family protein [Dactylosporangium sucinum]GGM63752.1 hypothetical protein GCM10007977_076630 [Dactylosporangium sucinum]